VGYIKRVVFGAVGHVTIVEELKHRIAAAIETITPEILEYVCRFDMCRIRRDVHVKLY
jgi:hypothetical protein